MPRFDDCVQITFTLEGGYSNAPGDHGGATQYGVTQPVYTAWRALKAQPAQDVKYITYAEAATIYFEQYWLPTKCDILPPPVDLVVFDMSINSGNGRAGKMLQTAVGIPADEVDGLIGRATLAAVAKIDPKTLAIRYLDAREAFYHKLVANDATQQKFLNGWINRVNFLRGVVGN